VHFGRACGQADHHAPTPPPRAERLSLWKNRDLLIFAGCLFLFQFANASVLPLAGEQLAYRVGTSASLTISALIIVPQIVVVLTAPLVGRLAQSWGRRPLLVLGFGALTVRAVLYALITSPPLLVAVQLLDGISGSTLGVLTALIIADLTRGSGRFNLAQGFVGTVAGIGASLSTTFFGVVAGHFGGAMGFAGIALVALSTVVIVWFWMPETRRSNANKAELA
jgi:MFS family permease